MSKKVGIIVGYSVILAVFIAISALVCNFVLINANNNRGMVMAYTAENVNANIAAEYKVGSGNFTSILSEDGSSFIEFSNKDTDESVTKNFEDVNLTEINGSVLVHYTIVNTGANSITLSADTFAYKLNNMKIEYAESENSNVWCENFYELAHLKEIGSLSTINLFVRISVVDLALNASFNCGFSFNLSTI